MRKTPAEHPDTDTDGPRPVRVVADSWYAAVLRERLGPLGDVVLLDDVADGLPRLVRRSARARRAVAFLVAVRGRDLVVATASVAGLTPLLLLCGALGARRVVLLEFLGPESARPESAGPGVRARLRRVRSTVRNAGLRRCLLAAQVLTAAERATCSAATGVPVERFHLLEWPSHRTSGEAPAPGAAPGDVVVVSGRRCDWETFFAAARGAGWDVTAVCAGTDAPRVRAMAGPGARVRCDISQDQHHAVLVGAAVYVVPLPPSASSIGQIRVMNAADAGVALVVSDVPGIAGYASADTAALVPPGDPTALREVVDELLADRPRRVQLVRNARAHRADRTMERYLDDVVGLVRGSLEWSSDRAAWVPRRR